MKLVTTREKQKQKQKTSTCTRLPAWSGGKKAIGKQDDDSYYKERIPNALYFRDINISRFINQIKVSFIIHFVYSFYVIIKDI